MTGIGDSINVLLSCSILLAFTSYVLAMLEGTLALRLRKKMKSAFLLVVIYLLPSITLDIEIIKPCYNEDISSLERKLNGTKRRY